MQNDERDVLAILEFDLREETIGVWLRCIMQRLEGKRRAIGDTSEVDQALDVARAELVREGAVDRSSLIRNDPRRTFRSYLSHKPQRPASGSLFAQPRF